MDVLQVEYASNHISMRFKVLKKYKTLSQKIVN